MPERYMTVQFGPRYGGCATVGYWLRDSSGVPFGDRIDTGIAEMPTDSGSFGALVSLPDDFVGGIVWDTGGESPAFAIEEINPDAAVPSPLDGSVSSGGSGQVEWSYQLLNQDSRSIVGADIYVSTDPEGRDVIAVARTDALGIVRFRLPPGEVFLWRSRSGCVFDNPDTRTVEDAS